MAKKPVGDTPVIHLRDWLEALGMSVNEAATAAQCDQSYISNILAGRKHNINALYLLRISEELGVTVNDFYRPLPSRSQLSAMKNLSPKAQAALLNQQRRKA